MHLGGGRGMGLDPTPELGHSCLQVGQGGWQMLPEVGLHSKQHTSFTFKFSLRDACVSVITSLSVTLGTCQSCLACEGSCAFLHVRGGMLLLCCACIGILYAVTYAFDPSVLQEHKHTQDVSTPSQTDMLDAEHHLVLRYAIHLI